MEEPSETSNYHFRLRKVHRDSISVSVGKLEGQAPAQTNWNMGS